MKKYLVAFLTLAITQGLIDFFYAKIFPEIVVSPLRATWIAFTALVLLLLVDAFTKNRIADPFIGALAVLSSAFFGALLVQSGALISKSALSGVVHVAILILTYFVLSGIERRRGSMTR